ncbi:MAG: 2-C-methyl-D-erythritol 4-phosphate cytidylyltransferase [Lachnospiraceae bacterium]|nr:2-C-methyl-D-erythritol 4-phosphate cytidylyltransferase [Lachnospiraceae bacterium]
MKKVNAIILSAGKGKRMNSDVSKQYLEINDKPIIYYTLKSFEKSNVDEIIIVVGKGDVEYVKKEIVDKYNISKITNIVEGGEERYDSVINGLEYLNDEDLVLIHDGARPLIKIEEINKIIDVVKKSGACIAGMPSKDTIKIINKEGVVVSTPERKNVWQIQTPQAFGVEIIKLAYKKMREADDKTITDDAMVIEKYTDTKIKVIETSYENIKVTTPEDLIFVERIIESRKK